VQGEGFHAGLPHVFVRFGNCNLRCSWCDTDFLTFDEVHVDDIVERVLAFGCNRVIFTGGEPALQDLQTIGRPLKDAGCTLSIETNGTVAVDPIIDWVCVSPKDQVYPDVAIRQREGDELKVVYVGQDLAMYDELRNGFTHHFLQPCYIDTSSVEDNGRAFAEVESIVKAAPGWRLSLQTHKWMGVD